MSPVSAQRRMEWSHRLAHALTSGGYASEMQLTPVLSEAQATGQPLAALLIARQLVQPGVVVGALAQLAQLQAVDLASTTPNPDAVAAVPEAIGREYGATGVLVDGDQLVVAFAEPPSPEDLQSLGAIIGLRIAPVLADPLVIEHLLTNGSGQAAPVQPSPVGAVASQPAAAHPGAAGAAPNGGAAPATAPGPGSTPGAPAGRPMNGGPNGANGGGPVRLGARGDDPGKTLLHIDDLLRYAVSVGASDLHLTAEMPGCIRLHGAVRPIEGCPRLDNETIREMVFGILPASQRERFEDERELDTSHSISGVGRFRVNVSLQRGTVAAALRPIPHDMPAFDSLGIPESIRSFTELRRGLILVTGPTGSGKSTTLASLVDIINRTKPLHIVTVEDPIEFLHEHKRSIINQREIGEDTFSFAEALRRVLRQDPDVILVGELRDLETISTALTAAETGHLVFATLHTQDAPQTVDRIIDVFPTNQQEQIRVMLAATLEGVVTQQLILNADGTGRVACCEVMMCTSAVRNLIRSNKTHQIYSLMQTGSTFGMQTMDQGLARMVKEGLISESVAFDRSRNEEDLRNHLNS